MNIKQLEQIVFCLVSENIVQIDKDSVEQIRQYLPADANLNLGDYEQAWISKVGIALIGKDKDIPGRYYSFISKNNSFPAYAQALPMFQHRVNLRSLNGSVSQMEKECSHLSVQEKIDLLSQFESRYSERFIHQL